MIVIVEAKRGGSQAPCMSEGPQVGGTPACLPACPIDSLGCLRLLSTDSLLGMGNHTTDHPPPHCGPSPSPCPEALRRVSSLVNCMCPHYLAYPHPTRCHTTCAQSCRPKTFVLSYLSPYMTPTAGHHTCLSRCHLTEECTFSHLKVQVPQGEGRELAMPYNH